MMLEIRGAIGSWGVGSGRGMEWKGECVGCRKDFFDLGIDHMHFPIFSYILLICAFDCIHLMLQQILLAQG